VSCGGLSRTLGNMKPESDVSDLDKLVNLLSDRHQNLRSVLQNFRKDSQARKTKIYIKTRQNAIVEYLDYQIPVT